MRGRNKTMNDKQIDDFFRRVLTRTYKSDAELYKALPSDLADLQELKVLFGYFWKREREERFNTQKTETVLRLVRARIRNIKYALQHV